MNVRAVALALPLAAGMACMHSQGTGAMGSAQTAAPSAPQPQAAAGTATQDPIMQPGPAVQGHAGDEVVAGRIAGVAGDTVSIETQQGSTRTLQVVPETGIQVDGQDASIQDLAEGQPVRASFDRVDQQDVAVKIHAGDFTPLGAGTPTDQGATPGASGGTGSGASDGGTGSAMPPAPAPGAGTGDTPAPRSSW